MPRQRRIEYEGAIYHVMARGNRREDIVYDDADRERFVETLAEVVEKSGWVLYAWVLMDNHYHFLFKTPEANLVQGMRWFQNTWTRRFNHRHQLWGHLFGGRYKAILVEDGAYLTRLVHYIHLNPVRAGLVKKRDGLEQYEWSSLLDYCLPPRKRRKWVAVERGLESMELPDTAKGRRRFLEWTGSCVDWRKRECAGIWQEEGESLQSTVRRGWYFGAEEFREKLVKRLSKMPAKQWKKSRSQGYEGAQARGHGKAEAERLIQEAEKAFALKKSDWKKLKKGDWRKGAIATLIRKRSLMDNSWLAERLHMGATNAVSRTMKESQAYLSGNRQAKKQVKLLDELSNSFA